MSWNINTGIIRKSEARETLNNLKLVGIYDSWTLDQFEEAKDAALLLLKSVPGPHIIIYLSGHANGVGYHKKDIWSNDFVNISIIQQTEEDLTTYGIRV